MRFKDLMEVASNSPPCPVFGLCGGCQYQDISYQEELTRKMEYLTGLLQSGFAAATGLVQPVIASPQIYHYRHRLDLKLKKTRDGKCHIGFSSLNKGPVLEIESCPIAMEPVSHYIPQLRKEAEAMLPGDYKMANLTLRCGEEGRVRWGGIGRRSLHLDSHDYFSATINKLKICYSLDTFFQANLSILPLVMNYIRSLPVWSQQTSFFDLYGGVGLFGFGVYDLVRRVVNIEENIHAVSVAQHNVNINGLNNVVVLAGRVEEVLPAMLEKELSGDNIVMVDPPRAGLTHQSVELLNNLRNVKHMLYLSCNPEGLVGNLAGLTAGGWILKSIQPFDFFPRTRHLEVLVWFEKNTSGSNQK